MKVNAPLPLQVMKKKKALMGRPWVPGKAVSEEKDLDLRVLREESSLQLYQRLKLKK